MLPESFRQRSWQRGAYLFVAAMTWTFRPSLSCFPQTGAAEPIRLGMIGLDTSHCIEFTKIFNDPSNPQYIPGFRVVAAYKGGSPDIDDSRSRVDGFTAELRDKWKIKIVDDIPTLCTLVDAVLEESLDGRVHLAEVRPVLAARKPVFIDKPMADSYHDASEIARLAKQAGVPWFSSSSLRFWEETERIKAAPEAGGIVGCDVYGPCPIQPQQPDLMWYGVHAIEDLYAIMGTGCETLTRVKPEATGVVIGQGQGGRL